MTGKDSADFDRTLTLLWRDTLGGRTGTRGPKQRSSVDSIVLSAIEIADEDGLGALSMRRVAEQQGLKVMGLYTYVAGKDELVALMVDQVAAENPLPEYPDDLRSRLETMARMIWEEVRAHPWLLQVQTARPVIGPHLAARYEWQVAALEGQGLTDIEMDQVVTLVTGFAHGAARAAVAQWQELDRSGITDAQWWEINAPILERLMPAERYPISGRVGLAAGEQYNAASDPAFSFEFGLQRILDGVERLIENSRTRSLSN